MTKLWSCSLLALFGLISLSGQSTLLHRNTDLYFHDFEEGSDHCYCERRFLKHYDARGCKASMHDDCGCPVQFECPNTNDIDATVCHYKSRTFNPGESIPTFNPCQECQCSATLPAEIVCNVTECQSNVSQILMPNCHPLYVHQQCCPYDIKCIETENDEREDSPLDIFNKTCVLNGHSYPLHAKIFNEEDPCEVCLCTEKWLQGDRSECYHTNCLLDTVKIDNGCVPIYQEDICCPVDFYCGLGDEFVADNSSQGWMTLESEPQEGDLQCTFSGQKLKLGDTISVLDDISCLVCVCRTPPDMTCIRKVCETNPDKDNCYPYQVPDGGCCPQFECLLKDEGSPLNNSKSVGEREIERETYIESCSSVSCEKEMICMLYGVICGSETCSPVPTCTWMNASCPTPLCDSGCMVSEQDEYRCPTCICEGDRAQNLIELKCPMPRCSGEDWRIVLGDDGCPACQVRDSCPPLECPENCNVEKEVEGQCPKCVCEDEEDGCPTPICENEGCHIGNNSHGCPTCICPENNGSRETEDAETLTSTNHQEQQQQQQQSVDKEEIAHPELSQRSYDDYDSEIVAMSDSASRTGERPLFRNRNKKLMMRDNGLRSNDIIRRVPNRQFIDEERNTLIRYITQQRENGVKPEP